MARIKGIILEHEKGKAIILTSTGEFKKVKVNRPVDIGEIYEAQAVSPWLNALAAGLILALLWGGWDYNSVQAYAQVSPELELGVNRWNRVVEVRAVDENGEKITQPSPLVGQRVDQAVETVVDQAIEAGNINQMIDVEKVIERDTGSSDIDTNDEDNDEDRDEKFTKVFPVQAADKGDKDEDFIKKVEANMNQGLRKSLEKNSAKLDREKHIKNIPSRGSKAQLESDKNQNVPSRGSSARDKVTGRDK